MTLAEGPLKAPITLLPHYFFACPLRVKLDVCIRLLPSKMYEAQGAVLLVLTELQYVS